MTYDGGNGKATDCTANDEIGSTSKCNCFNLVSDLEKIVMAGEVAQCRGVAVDSVRHWQQGMEEGKEQAQAKWRNRLLFLKNL